MKLELEALKNRLPANNEPDEGTILGWKSNDEPAYVPGATLRRQLMVIPVLPDDVQISSASESLGSTRFFIARFPQGPLGARCLHLIEWGFSVATKPANGSAIQIGLQVSNSSTQQFTDAGVDTNYTSTGSLAISPVATDNYYSSGMVPVDVNLSNGYHLRGSLLGGGGIGYYGLEIWLHLEYRT